MARILETNNYSKFVLSPFNRNVRRTWNLETSMLKYGFRDSEPIEVIRLENGHLEIQEGHHRFEVCKKLGIPVKYVEVNEALPRGVRAKTVQPWSLKDYLDSYVRANLPTYLVVKKYQERSGIPLSCCINMLAGNSAGSGNWSDHFKNGTYRLVAGSSHADMVAAIIIHCKKLGISWATNQIFVFGVSKIIWAESFDLSVLLNKISLFPERMKKQATKDDYVKMLDEIYNRKSQTKVPLAFQAEEAARKRNVVVPGEKAKSKVFSGPPPAP
jgi:hypothetical protein